MQKRIPTELISYLIMKTIEKNGSSYGYELITTLKDISNNHWNPSYGTIYGALNRMEEGGFIRRTDMSDEDRKYYELTKKGKEELEKKEKNMADIGEISQQNALGFLCVYKKIYGKEKFNELMEKIRTEFNM